MLILGDAVEKSMKQNQTTEGNYYYYINYLQLLELIILVM